MSRVLLPLPDTDFDTTEVAVPWRMLRDAGHDVVFATESGATPACDPLLLTGVLFGELGAEEEPKAFYAQMLEDPSFRAPVSWRDLDPADFDALLLAGGHAPGMRQFLGSAELQEKVGAFWALERPVAAICHGVLLLARATDPRTGAPALAGVPTTCLPNYMELLAWGITAWKLGSYYRTYPQTVQDEVAATGAAVERGPITLFTRGTMGSDAGTFLVEHGRYVSGRWPGDAYALARALMVRLDAAPAS
jgi:putative intracellular protease/amidase